MKFDIERCGYCGACISVCPNGSLELNETVLVIDGDKCDDCRRCSIVCPLGAFMEVEKNQDFSNHQNRKFWRYQDEI